MSYTIVGVIGHIDHGKTTLVGALTGVDTDTHPEEKRRGITIDLGFASFTEGENRFALIDAPGHQKYIGNLLAGVSAVDVGLLVVACDQGIQAQTLEHASILQSLGVKSLIAAITRVDLSGDARLAELTEELDVFLADYGYCEVPTIPVSSVTGEGLVALREQLCRFARQTPRRTDAEFRMPIDRVFSVPGRGCVAAGTLWAGRVRVGDHVRIAGTDHLVRVRELEVHGEPADESFAGFRTALNLTGVSANDLTRGDELVAESFPRTLNRFAAKVSMFAEASELKCPATVQLHTATTACEARITGVKQLVPGESTVVMIDTATPIVANYNQPLLLRCPYPVGSFAGGHVVAPIDQDLASRRGGIELGKRVVDASPAERLVAWVDFAGEISNDNAWGESAAGITRDEWHAAVQKAVAEDRLVQPNPQWLVSQATVNRVRDYAVKLLSLRAEESEDAWMDEESLIQKVRTAGSPVAVRWGLAQLLSEKKLVRLNRMVAIASKDNLLSKKQKAMMAELLKIYADQRMPPTLAEVTKQLAAKPDTVASLVRFATQQRVLTDLGNGFLIATAVFHQLCGELGNLFSSEPSQSVASIRDHWEITRKHAIPLLEYCDRIGVTSRSGNDRGVGPALNSLLSEQAIESQE